MPPAHLLPGPPGRLSHGRPAWTVRKTLVYVAATLVQLVANLLVRVMVEAEAREQLEARYLGGQSALFADAEDAWDRFAELVDRLWSIAERLNGAPSSTEESPDGDPLAGRVAERARYLADDARITTFERLGDMAHAVAIVERRLMVP